MQCEWGLVAASKGLMICIAIINQELLNRGWDLCMTHFIM